MKKILLALTIIFLFSFNIVKLKAEETILYRSGTNNPVKYYNSNVSVTIPTKYNNQKQEFRAVWVATVDNLDITTQSSIEQYKKEFIKILDNLQNLNMNAIIFQVRPMNDAFYPSNLNPWSRYLTGVEGNDPGWDPLEWMVAQTHKRGIEFHAWFNPYRVTNSTVTNKTDFLNTLNKNNFARKNPDLVIAASDNKLILNPGEPQVQQFIIDTVMEVAQNYDIDAIHFDDYFYPYGGIGNADATTYSKNNPKGLSLDNWRRDNVDTVIKRIKEELTNYNKTANKGIQFGISPFGIWANKKNNALGSNTSGLESYYAQYADTRKWVKEEYIDYIVPQLYWEFEKEIASYADLVDWWSNVVSGTKVNLYIGHGIYRHNSDSALGWANYKQVPNQILYNQKHDEVKGSVFFNYNAIFNKANGVMINARNTIQNDYYTNKAIPTKLNNINAVNSTKVENLVVNAEKNGFKIEWDSNKNDKMYAIYRFNENETVNINDYSKLVDVIYKENLSKTSYIDIQVKSGTKYKYVVTPINYSNTEGPISQVTTKVALFNPKINNSKDLTIEINSKNINYLDGVKATDGFGNDITSLLTVDDSNVNIKQLGEYVLKYIVKDKDNLSSEVSVNVKVVDTTKPTLVVLKKLEFLINSSKPNWLQYIQVMDNNDGDITSSSKVMIDDSRINFSKEGKYFLVIEAEDSSGNKAIITERVFITENLSTETNNSIFNNKIVKISCISSLVLLIGISTIVIIKKQKNN